MKKDLYLKEKMDLAYSYAWQRCDATCPDEVVKELAKKILKEEITDWDVIEDEHDLFDEQL